VFIAYAFEISSTNKKILYVKVLNTYPYIEFMVFYKLALLYTTYTGANLKYSG